MQKLLVRVLIGIVAFSILLGLYLAAAEGIPPTRAFLISFMLLGAGEPMGLDQKEDIGVVTEGLVFLQTLLGLLSLGALIGMLANYLLSEKLTEMFQREKVTMENHVILCGLGNVGINILEELEHFQQEVVCLDLEHDQEKADRARRMGFKVIKCDIRDDESLEQGNIEKAKSLIIVTGDDLVNMEVALTARERRPDLLIVMRMFDQRLAQKVAKAFDIRVAFSSSKLAAPAFAAASFDRRVFQAQKVEQQYFVSAEVELEPGCRLEGTTIDDLARSHDLAILKLISGEERLRFPTGTRALRGGDRLFITSTFEAFHQVSAECGRSA